MGDFVGGLSYGDRVLRGLIPTDAERAGRLLDLELPGGTAPIDLDRAFDTALLPLARMLDRHPGGFVTIGVDDHTRRNEHTRQLLPRLLRFLRSRGVERSRTRILITGGTHRPPREGEYARILGNAVWREYGELVEAHDCDGRLAGLGILDDGIPVEFNATAAKADVHIALTDLDYHYFAGVAGGPKQLMPGLAGRAVITAEHLRMFGDLGFAPGVEAGVIDGNPVYEYKRRALAVIRQHFEALGHDLFGITCVVDPRGRLVHVAGGDIEQTHREAIPVLDSVYTAKLPELADVVIQGARSLGINLYQAGKAFNSARRAVRAGGRILVAAPLPDAWGNVEFERLMKLASPLLELARRDGAASPAKAEVAIENMIREVQTAVMADFRIGKQKPVDLLVTLRRVGWDRLFLVSDGMPPDEQRALPIQFVGKNGQDPETRIREWTSSIEPESPTYAIVDDPGFRIVVGS